MSVVPTPWEGAGLADSAEQATSTDLTVDELTSDELAAVLTATAAQRRRTRSGAPLAEELLGLTWRHDGDRVIGSATLGPHLGNRVGTLQGGALYGIAALAAERLAGPAMVLAESSLQYLRAGIGTDLTATATLTRRGRTVAFIDVAAELDARQIATGQHTFFAV